jgi:hypothetical protein
VIEHCISTLKLNREKKILEIYVTDALKAIVENTTHLVGRTGVVDYGVKLKERYFELINETEEPQKVEEDTRDASEVATDIWSRIRGN